LVMIEVQNGEYLGDDDIVRFPEDSQVAPGWKTKAVKGSDFWQGK
jgi:hypothetical protein